MNYSVKRTCQLIKKQNIPNLPKFYTITHLFGEKVNIMCNIGGIMKAQEDILIRFYNFETKEFEYEKFAIFANQLCQNFSFKTLRDIAAAIEILNLNEYGFLLPVQTKLTAKYLDKSKFEPPKMQIINRLLQINPATFRISQLNIEILNKILRHLSLYQDRFNMIKLYEYQIDIKSPPIFIEQNDFPNGYLTLCENYPLFNFIRNWQGSNGEKEDIFNHFIKL